MPKEGLPLIPAHEILHYEEIVRIAAVCVSLGIEKIRITGGEPLVRRGLTRLVAQLSRIQGVKDLCLTTNGVLLAEQVDELQQAGLHRVTVSLDSLRKDRYQRITGFDFLEKVLKGIETLFRLGMEPVKINTVIVRGVNDDEVVDFAGLTKELPVETRFIERMPLGEFLHGCGLWEREGLPSQVIMTRIEEGLGPLEPARPVVAIPGPAKLYRLRSSKGRIGVISPVTEPFCSQCTRIRLTPEGKLRNCLLREEAVDIKAQLRRGLSDEKFLKIIRDMMLMKRRDSRTDFQFMKKAMVQIGG
jgi:cyclic pyranopterin phosphate synthase